MTLKERLKRLNKKRASKAAACILYGGFNNGDIRDDMVDMVTDLMHLADQKNIDFEGVINSAKNHFDEEKV